jgi:flagellar biosynthesis protein FlhF
MHMKFFSAPTMTETMEMLRFEMGAESIIIATRDKKYGAVITASMDKNKPRVITTDTQRAGGIEQLAALTRILGIELEMTNDASGLLKLMQGSDTDVPILIYTSGKNPFNTTEMDHLEALASIARAENIVIVAARGGDAMETANIAAEFSSIGAKRMVITRLDMTRRLGSILTAAHAGRLSLSDVSITPGVAEGINPINPASLARLIMPYTDTNTNGSTSRTAQNTNITEAMI